MIALMFTCNTCGAKQEGDSEVTVELAEKHPDRPQDTLLYEGWGDLPEGWRFTPDCAKYVGVWSDAEPKIECPECIRGRE